MTPRRRLFRFPTLTRARALREVDEELEFHLAIVGAHLVAQGWQPAEAATEARRRFGDLDYTRDYCYREDTLRAGETLRMTHLDELFQDLRYALRALRRTPGFTAVALLTLALGIGANTAVFSVVRGVLLSPLPFADPDRVVRIWNSNHSTGTEKGPLSEPDFNDWRAQTRVAQSIGGAFFFENGLSGLDLTGTGNPERISAALVTRGFFETLRPRPFLGRTLNDDDQVEGRNRVVVLGHGLWTRRFNADRNIVGKTIQIDNEPFTVAGVMPREFTYPADNALDAWVPLSYYPPSRIGRVRGAKFLIAVARLKPGTTVEQLRQDLAGIAARNAKTYPDNPGWDDAAVLPIRDSIVGDVRRPLIILFGAVALLMLITCVNIASLLLARASARQGEMAVRAALGAGRGRIIRQLLTESLLLSTIGGALGVGLAFVAVKAFRSGGISLPGTENVRIDGVILLFTVVAAVLSGLLFGSMPAFRAAARSLQETLRSDTRGAVGAMGQRLRSALVLAEVALAVMLVVGAGLATKSFVRLMNVDPGFRPEKAMVATISIGQSHLASPDAGPDYAYRVLGAIAAVPGVKAVGSIRDLPMRGTGESYRPGALGTTIRGGEGPVTQIHHISIDYFKAIGIPVKEGRVFTMSDRQPAPPVVIINEELAHRLWPNEKSVVGKMLLIGPQEVQVVGVVGDVRQNGFAEPIEPAMYVHILRNMRARMSIVVRTDGDPLALAGAVRRAIWSVDPSQTVTNVSSLQEVVIKSVSRQRVLAWLLGLFGIIGLTLGALGIYGVLAFAVAQRRKEIGVRVALGASPRSVTGLIVGRGVLLAVAGIAIGVVGARLLSHTMQVVLFDIQPGDPATYVQVALVLFAAAVLASWLPARRALAIDPVTALRSD